VVRSESMIRHAKRTQRGRGRMTSHRIGVKPRVRGEQRIGQAQVDLHLAGMDAKQHAAYANELAAVAMA
jgi:hypothetical protein